MAAFGRIIIVPLLLLHAGLVMSTSRIEEELRIHYKVIENQGEKYTAKLNISTYDYERFYSDRISIHACFPNKVTGYRSIGTQSASIQHVDGCAHVINVRSSIGYDVIQLILYQEGSMVSYSGFIPNWYIDLGNNDVRPILHTHSENNIKYEIVDEFRKTEQLKRTPLDRVDLKTSSNRVADYTYRNNTYALNDKPKVQSRIIPKLPINLTNRRSIRYTTVHNTQWTFIPHNEEVRCSRKCVRQHLDERVTDGYRYKVDASRDIVDITAASEDLLKYAMMTHYQLLKRFNDRLPEIDFTDKPRYNYRGLMLDISRHFMSVNSILSYIDIMSYYKMNYLHLKLTDDEGWRLFIDDIPELTQYGSIHCFDESRCLKPQYGQKINVSGQYLTKAQYIEILRFAKERMVTIIPEFSFPGHARAAIHAMKLRYQRRPATDYRLSYESDGSNYIGDNNYRNSVINPCLESTYNFIKAVLQSVKRYHDEAQVELKIIHLGGQEIPAGTFSAFTICQSEDYRRNDEESYHRSFYGRLRSLVKKIFSEETKIGLWDDAFFVRDSTQLIDKIPFNRADFQAVAFSYRPLHDLQYAGRAITLANAGIQVVLTPSDHLFLDHPHEATPYSNGQYYSTRFTSISKIYKFRPDSLYSNRGEDLYGGRVFDCDSRCPSLDTGNAQNIIGIQGSLFGALTRSDDIAYKMVFPRLFAIADKAWSKASWEDNPKFTSWDYLDDYATFMQSVGLYEIPFITREMNIIYNVLPPATKFLGEYLNNSGKPTLAFAFFTEFTNQKMHISFGNLDDGYKLPGDYTKLTVEFGFRTADLSRFYFMSYDTLKEVDNLTGDDKYIYDSDLTPITQY